MNKRKEVDTMSKRKRFLKEKRYIHSCSWAVRWYYNNLSRAGCHIIIKENRGSLTARRLAKRLYKKRKM